MMRRALILLIAVPAFAQQGPPAALPPDCVPNRPQAVQARLDDDAAAPTQFLPKLELARCYDLAWRMADVEPAILTALGALRVEARTKPVPLTSLPAGAAVAGIDVPHPTRIADVLPEYPPRTRTSGLSAEKTCGSRAITTYSRGPITVPAGN